MDLLPLSDAAADARREIRCLRANVTQAEALAALERRGGLIRGQLRQVAAAYLPFRLYRVEIVNRGSIKSALYAADAVSGVLDLYEFAAAPAEAELVTVTTRNAPTSRLATAHALELLENKVRRAIFQTGFFGVRDLQIRTRALELEFHVPYWLGFFGHGERATLQAMDAVRRSFEGAKARAVFSDWLTAVPGEKNGGN
ncbi:MAG TPA: hypothetical protein VJQ52_05950 [Steroidobacteraceae bacterium]|nr:hypothetical protein [Steroidobacteraceae bacterium]